MATQAINTGSGNPSPNPPQRYASNAPEFVGGQTNPQTGAIIPASQTLADVAPAPQTPTTQLANVNPPSSTSKLAPLAGSYLGGSIGGEIGAQLAGGADLGAAASSVANNIGTVLKEPIAANTGDLSSLADASGESLGTAFDTSLGTAAGAGLFTAGIGAATGEQAKVYVPQAVGSAAGAGIGTFIGSLFARSAPPSAAWSAVQPADRSSRCRLSSVTRSRRSRASSHICSSERLSERGSCLINPTWRPLRVSASQ